jgi:hypothetical protein
MIGPLVALINVENNFMNPHYVFAEIFAGKPALEVWEKVGGGFPGGHFYFQNFTAGDALTQFGMALGCFVGFPALLVAAVAYIKEKSIGYTLLCLWVAFMIAVSAIGLIKGH